MENKLEPVKALKARLALLIDMFTTDDGWPIAGMNLDREYNLVTDRYWQVRDDFAD